MRHPRSILALLLPAALVLGACQPQDAGDGAALSPEERIAVAEEIRELTASWDRMVQADDTAGIVELYVEGAGRLIPPDAPPVVGHDALRQFWGAALDFPLLTFGADTVVVSEGGDMATDLGSFRMQPAEGAPEVEGNYVVVWIRQDGEWKVLVDIFNPAGPPGGGGE